jgi:hypothetical protein
MRKALSIALRVAGSPRITTILCQVFTPSHSPKLHHVHHFATDEEMDHVLRTSLGQEANNKSPLPLPSLKITSLRTCCPCDVMLGHPGLIIIFSKGFAKLKPEKVGAKNGLAYEIPVGGDPILEALYKRMSSVVPGLGHWNMSRETFRIRRYLPDGFGALGGDTHFPHIDYAAPDDAQPEYALLLTM